MQFKAFYCLSRYTWTKGRFVPDIRLKSDVMLPQKKFARVLTKPLVKHFQN